MNVVDRCLTYLLNENRGNIRLGSKDMYFPLLSALCPARPVFCCRYQEKFYFNPGDTGFQTFQTKFAKIGVAVCWDQWFPEAARCMALMGAEVTSAAPRFFHPEGH